MHRHGTRRLAFLGLAFWAVPMHGAPRTRADIQNSRVWIALSCGHGCLWEYGGAQQRSAYQFTPPIFSVDGKQVSAEVPHFAPVGTPIHLDNRATEYSFEGPLAQDPHLRLRLQFQVNDEIPVIRFRYMLEGDQPRTLSAPGGANSLTYLRTSLQQLPEREEIRLSNFAQLTHSFTLSEERIEERYFD